MDNVTDTTFLTLDNITVDSTTLRPSRTLHPRLQEIFHEAVGSCMATLGQFPPLETDGAFCNRTADAYGGCWPDSLPGRSVKIPCPNIPIFNKQGFAFRKCTSNGTWLISNRTGATWVSYKQCLSGTNEFEDDRKYIYIFIGGFSLSLLMLLISLVIFFRFRQLRCDRITIHKNLFISYVLTGVSWISYYVLVALDGDIMLENPLWCQVLHVICQYFTVCNFLWMFCEGLYLNTIMVYAFGTGKVLITSCYLVGWCLPLALTSVYATIRKNDEISNIDCWLVESPLQWIMYGPIVLSIVVNVIFLINIVRLLVTKLRQMPEVAQTRKATRATLILVPLLGLQYLLFPIRPSPESSLEDFYHIIVALLVSLQGAFVSVIYCFCNGEVIAILRRKYKQHKLMNTRSLNRSSSGHGTTTYTIIDQIDTTKRNSTSKLYEIAEPYQDMNIKVAAYTVNEKSSNTSRLNRPVSGDGITTYQYMRSNDEPKRYLLIKTRRLESHRTQSGIKNYRRKAILRTVPDIECQKQSCHLYHDFKSHYNQH